MLFYYITFAMSAVWLILCIISAVTEHKPPKKAKTRNFFRSLRISLREITLLWTVVIVEIVVYVSAKTDNFSYWWICLTVGMFLLGLVILEHFRIFGIAKTKKRVKRLQSR